MKSFTDSLETELVLLAPSGGMASRCFQRVERDRWARRDLLARMQRFRGAVYLDDGAIGPQELTWDRRHALDIDERSWHVLMVNSQGDIRGCLRILEHRNLSCFEELWIQDAALAHCAVWGSKLRRAVESEVSFARRERLSFAEVGGWAISGERRCTTDALRIILASYALLQLLGGYIGVATATTRHHSSAMLRRIGLRSLELGGTELPSYYDPKFRCDMEVLRFDSRCPNPKYLGLVLELRSYLKGVPVIADISSSAENTAARMSPGPVHVPAYVPAWGQPA